MNKIDKLLELLLEDMDGKQVFKLIFNKMTKQAKRQLLQEILNTYLGGISPVEGYIFRETQDDKM